MGESYVHPREGSLKLIDFGCMILDGTIFFVNLESVGINESSTIIIIRMILGAMIQRLNLDSARKSEDRGYDYDTYD